MSVTFAELQAGWSWWPIPGCPGRFTLRGQPRDLPPQQLVGTLELRSFRVAAARDTVLVVALPGGGLISYARADGTFVHTLNTEQGFARKLAQLGIEPPAR